MKTAAPRPYSELPQTARLAADGEFLRLHALLRPLLPPEVEGFTCVAVMDRWLQDPQLGAFIGEAIDMDGGPHGAMFMTMQVICHGNITVFEVDPVLAQSLLDTDLSAKNPVPAHFVRLPLETPVFVHIPQPIAGLEVVDGDDVLPLCGYYLRTVAVPDGRVLEVVAVSVPPHGYHDTDRSNFLYTDIPIKQEDEDQDLLRVFDIADRSTRAIHGEADRPELRDRMTRHLSFLVKLLIYLAMPDARRELCPDRTNAVQALTGLGERKREAARGRLAKAYDFVRITAPPVAASAEGVGTHASPSVHHRRGHFRLAKVGQGRAEQKLVWVRPTIVAGSLAPNRSYRVS